jgi:hypothetical protein
MKVKLWCNKHRKHGCAVLRKIQEEDDKNEAVQRAGSE